MLNVSKKQYLKVLLTLQMDIHIRGTVEFEKCLDHTFTDVVAMTRTRMAIQQLLDQREDQPLLIHYLEQYTAGIDQLLTKIKPLDSLKIQPCFTWVIDHETIQTPCWLLEAIVPRVVLAHLYAADGQKLMSTSNFKEANKMFKEAEKHFDASFQHTIRWKWKAPHMNHPITNQHWHLAQKHLQMSYQHLCFVGQGIENITSNKPMLTLANRAFKSAVFSAMHWKSTESTDVLHVTDGLRYLYSSNVLWDEGKYGMSIFRLQHWFGQQIPRTLPGPIQKEFENIDFLLKERIHTNNSAYFDTIEPDSVLMPTLHEIIHSN